MEEGQELDAQTDMDTNQESNCASVVGGANDNASRSR
jgi:hypothetical protein